MKWIKVDSANLPKDEVLARNDEGFTKVGILGIEHNVVYVNAGTDYMIDITYYILEEDLLNLPKE